MLKIVHIKVHALTPTHYRVDWEIEPTFEDPLDYTFRVMRSEAASGPYEYISEPFEDKYFFIDSTVDMLTRICRSFSYKIEVTSKKDPTQVEVFGPTDPSPPPDPIATEMRRQAMLIYKTVAGRRCWLFPVRTFGQRCPECWDRVTKRPIKTRCPTCYDTTWARGYMNPMEVWVQFEPTPKQMLNNQIRVEKMQDQVAHLGYYPEVKPLDMLVEPEGTRWIVTRVQGAERLRAKVRQTVVMDELEAGHIGYDVPVNYSDILSDDFCNPFLMRPQRSLGQGVQWGS